MTLNFVLTSQQAEGNKICESSIVIDVNGALSVNHETVEKQADVGAANVNILNVSSKKSLRFTSVEYFIRTDGKSRCKRRSAIGRRIPM